MMTRTVQTTDEAATSFVRRHIGPSPRDVAGDAGDRRRQERWTR